jgi:formylglycine-generating enzyme required for sulfatase activity
MLSFVGKLSRSGQPVTDTVGVSFRFKKAGAVSCTISPVDSKPDASGNFQIAIPLAGCPQSLFDGSDVVYDILVGDEVAVQDQPVGFVPNARYADQVGYPDCPPTYDRDAAETGVIVCRKGSDTLVRVGTGGTAFWVDRYEASVWERPDGSGNRYGEGTPDYLIPKNGQFKGDSKGYAVSKAGILPSSYISWFQADVACRASGKRLPTSAEWGAAAMGTPDPGNSTGDLGKCRTSGSLRTAGQGTDCVSNWGAQDMIGNAAEWVSEWYGTVPDYIQNNAPASSPWGSDFGSDATIGLVSYAWDGTQPTAGLPAALLRGGGVWQSTGAGVFSLNLTLAPSSPFSNVGFRCVIPR